MEILDADLLDYAREQRKKLAKEVLEHAFYNRFYQREVVRDEKTYTKSLAMVQAKLPLMEKELEALDEFIKTLEVTEKTGV